MHRKIKIIALFLMMSVLCSAIVLSRTKQKRKNSNDKNIVVKESKSKSPIKADTVKIKPVDEVTVADTLQNADNLKFKAFKKSAHASYYAARFEGKRTASGKK